MKKLNLFWGAGLFLHPFILRFTPYSTLRFGKDHFFVFLVTSALVLFGLGHVPSWLRAVVFSFIPLAWFNTLNIANSFHMYNSVMFLSGALLLMHFYGNFTTKFKRFFFQAQAVMLVVFVLWTAVEYFDASIYTYIAERFLGYGMYSRNNKILTGVLNNPNLDSAYYSFCVPAILYLKRYWLFIPLAIGLWFSDSMMGYASTLSALSFYFIIKKTNINTALLFLVAVFGMAIMYMALPHTLTGIDSARFMFWDKMFELSGFTLFGYGLGWFPATFPAFYNYNKIAFLQEHNELMSMYFAFGFVGLALLVGIILRALKNPCVYMATGLFAVFVNSLASFPFHITPLAVIGLFFIAGSLKTSEAYV